jgi:hypothetical protein
LFCTNCGKPVKEHQKFCGSCGMPIEPESISQGLTTSHPVSASSSPGGNQFAGLKGETIKIIIPNLMLQKSWGRSDTFNLIVTDQRSIFARLTNQIMNDTIKMRREKAAAEGKGFFGKWAAQMSGFNTYTDRYHNMTPDEALLENKENFQIQNSLIKNFKSGSDGDEDHEMYNIEITTATQKLKFKTQYDPDKALKAAYTEACRFKFGKRVFGEMLLDYFHAFCMLERSNWNKSDNSLRQRLVQSLIVSCLSR